MLRLARKIPFNKKNFSSLSVDKDKFEDGTLLCKLAYLGDLEGIKNCILQNGYDVNAQDADLRTPLHLASAEGHIHIVKFLVDHGACLQNDNFGNLAIHDAKVGNHREVKELLQTVPSQATKTDVKHPFQSQIKEVEENILKTGIFGLRIINQEIANYYLNLNMHSMYFELFDSQLISRHILSLMMAQQIENICQKNQGVLIQSIYEQSPFYLATVDNASEVYVKLEKDVSQVPISKAVSLQIHRSFGVVPGQKTNLEVFQVFHNDYSTNSLDSQDITQMCGEQFLKYPLDIQAKYQEQVMQQTTTTRPLVQSFSYMDNHVVLMTCQQEIKDETSHDSTKTHFTKINQLSCILRDMGVHSHMKTMDTFGNGVAAYAFYLKKTPTEEQTTQIHEEAVHLMITSRFLMDFYVQQKMTLKEHRYVQAGYNYTTYFIAQESEEFDSLVQNLKDDHNSLKKLNNIVQQQNSNLKQKINSVLERNLALVKELYADFERRQTQQTCGDATNLIERHILKIRNVFDQKIMKSFYMFNKSIQKTNFFCRNKSSHIFQLDPQTCLTHSAYMQKPDSMYMLNGRDFSGFQINFGQTSRGNVLISQSSSNYRSMKNRLFQDTYVEALKQLHINKDLVESGSHSYLLMKNGRSNFKDFVYRCYKDNIEQLLGNQPGVTDLYKKNQSYFLGQLKFNNLRNISAEDKEILFTDSKTVDFSNLAIDRHSLPYKSIQQYLSGVQKKNGWSPEKTSSFIVGGPSGHLARSMIQNAKERIVGIVDSSGIVYDPQGLDKDQLIELCHSNSDISEYNGRLSADGYKVKLTDENVTLPDGTHYNNGYQLRNEYYQTKIEADFLVVCGGPKEAISLEQSSHFLKDNGTFISQGEAKFRYIVEASDDYFTLNATEHLFKNNCMIFQNTSTQKAGVTCSSMEVLCYLALNASEYEKMSKLKNGKPSKFMEKFMKDVVEKIQANASAEFEFIWKKSKDFSTYLQLASITQLSQNIQNLSQMIRESELFQNDNIKRKVYGQFIPKSILDLVPYEEICTRIPLDYQKQMFANHLAQQFYFNHGQESSVFQFFNFMRQFEHEQ